MKAKKPFYISFSMSEYEALISKASCQEIAMYLILKKQANFKTGAVGEFSPINYQRLAEALSRPKRNTAPAETYDRGKARDIVARLQKIGLVADTRMEGDNLKLRLPFSPIDPFTAKAPPPQPAPALNEPAKLQQATARQTAESAAQQGFTDEDIAFLSTDSNDNTVSIVIPQYNQERTTTLNTGDTETQGEDTSPSVASDLHPHPFLKGGQRENQSERPSQEQVHARLSAAGGFRMLELDRTMRICGDIAAMIADIAEVDTAVTAAIMSKQDLTAGTIYNIVRDRKKQSSGQGEPRRSAFVL